MLLVWIKWINLTATKLTHGGANAPTENPTAIALAVPKDQAQSHSPLWTRVVREGKQQNYPTAGSSYRKLRGKEVALLASGQPVSPL